MKFEPPIPLATAGIPDLGIADPIDAPILSVDTSDIDDRLFRRFAENMPTLCWMANADGYIFWYNRRWHEYCGTTPEQMEGWGWQSVHDPEILTEVMTKWQSSIATGEPFEMIFPLRGADGAYRPFLTRVSPYRSKNGPLTRWFGVNIDVTAQAETESQLKAANAQLRANAAERDALLRQLVEGVIVTDPAGRITFVNEAAARLHGVTRLDVEPDDYAETYSLFTMAGEVHSAETLPLTRAVRNLETVVDAHWRIRRPDGTEVLAIGNAQPFYGEAGKMIGAVLTIHDDTGRYAAEEALSEAVESREILLQEVNHRVKNSLQLVSSLLSLEAARTASTELKNSLLAATARISIVADMHQSLYSTGLHDRVEITRYLRDIAKKTMRALDPESRIKLEFESSRQLTLKVDVAVPLALVINELITNAVKYAFGDSPGCEVHILISADTESMIVSVHDNGCGLPDEFKLERARSVGMRIVGGLVSQIGGTVAIEQREIGAGFIVTLPSSLFVDDPAALRQSGEPAGV